MSFRRRLTLFFVLIVIVPMVSLTVVVFRLLSDNENGKADARVAARQQAAINLYGDLRDRADDAAVALGKDVRLATALRNKDTKAAERRAAVLLHQLKAKRVVITNAGKTLIDVGPGNATFPITRQLRNPDGSPFGAITVSVTGPRAFGQLVKRITGMEVILRTGDDVLATTLRGRSLPEIPIGTGHATIGDEDYRTTGFKTPSFDNGRATTVAVMDRITATSDDVRSSRAVAGVILLGFFVLAFTFAVLVSRSLQRQIDGFLQAARRLGKGDFTTKVPTVGNDEFSALGQEFNAMSSQLEQRLEELRAEQARLANAMRRIGETFASNLDRDALLEIVLRTALDGVGASGGRATLRQRPGAQLHQIAQAGSLDDLVPALHAAESAVLEAGAAREANVGETHALAYPLRAAAPVDAEGPPRITGIVALARVGPAFTESEQELFHYLAGQASVSVENVGLHETVERQAVEDELTGLSNRRRFQETLSTEVERSRRFGQPLGLVMLDIDNFKTVNDTYGHPAGDVVLQEVAKVLRASSREIDEPARYGGEELAVVLPGTDLEGAYNLAERVRTGVEALDLPIFTDAGERLSVTASFGVATMPASSTEARGLVAAADAALYEAKRAGKNQTVRAAETPTA